MSAICGGCKNVMICKYKDDITKFEEEQLNKFRETLPEGVDIKISCLCNSSFNIRGELSKE
jgi:hypothetical protein